MHMSSVFACCFTEGPPEMGGSGEVLVRTFVEQQSNNSKTPTTINIVKTSPLDWP